MKKKLYANMTRITQVFLVSIGVVTVTLLLARLLFFRDMASATGGKDTIVHGDDKFIYSYNSKVYFSSPNDEGDVLIENPADNKCLLSANIMDPDSQDSILYTGFIEPGILVDTARLDTRLENGVHSLVIKITAYTLDTPHEPLGSVEEPILFYIGEKPPQTSSAATSEEE